MFPLSHWRVGMGIFFSGCRGGCPNGSTAQQPLARMLENGKDFLAAHSFDKLSCKRHSILAWTHGFVTM
eukprot:scaffold298149_cov18-Tisochrysis_lutea.AAC.1